MYDLDNPNPQSFNDLPEWIQTKIGNRVQDNVTQINESENPAPQESDEPRF